MKSHEANGKEINGKETNAKETNGTNANGSKEQISFNLTDMNKSWVYALLMNLSKICTCCFLFQLFFDTITAICCDFDENCLDIFDKRLKVR